MHNKLSLNIITLGCSKNTVDSEKLLRQFNAAGYKVVYDEYNFDSKDVIINTCGFINDAKEESIETILQFVEARKEGRIDNLFVMGCLSERYMEQLRSEIPEVDQYFGVNKPLEVLKGLGIDFHEDLINERILSGPSHYAYLKISEGCNRTCAFCAIPKIRGKYISTPVEQLVEEAAILAKGGVKELILIAQDLSYYGIDLYGKQKLVYLVEKLSEIEELKWIRLHYLYPANFPLELIDLMNSNSKVCQYIDLPVQHISDSVLSAMKRSHNGPETRELLERIRKELPTAAVRTTIIAGHPGESDKDYNELLAYIQEYRFDRLGVFTYSHEENTYGADNYEDSVPEELKKERMESLMKIQQDISLEKNNKSIGNVLEVIIDREEGLYFFGRSQYDSPEVDQEIMIPKNDNPLQPGDFTFVKITSASEFDLVGEIVDQQPLNPF
jgi:ribosomal protein S12 methylthiotransferase